MERERERDRERQTDRQTDRQTETERRSCSDTLYMIVSDAGSCTLYKQINQKDGRLYRLYKRISDQVMTDYFTTKPNA